MAVLAYPTKMVDLEISPSLNKDLGCELRGERELWTRVQKRLRKWLMCACVWKRWIKGMRNMERKGKEREILKDR